MYHRSNGHRGSYSQQWPTASDQAVPSSSSSSSQWTSSVRQEGSGVKTNNQYPSLGQGDADNSFRRTLCEIEDTYYRTFLAATEADGYQPQWHMGSNGKARTDESSIGFFPHTSGTTLEMTAGTYASDYASFSSQPPPLVGASSGRDYSVSDVHMSNSTVQMASYTLSGAYQSLPSPPTRSPIGAMGHRSYHSPIVTQAESSIAGALRPSDSMASSLSPSYNPSLGNGPLSGTPRAQDTWSAPRSLYVNSNVPGRDDARVPPMGSLGYPDSSSDPALAAPLATIAPSARQHPYETAPQPIDLPPSPHPDPTSFYPSTSTADPSSPNHPERAYYSPDPTSPSSITLHPVPQAPINYHHHSIQSWPSHQISPEPVPSPREASVGRHTKRKRGRDSNKKPPLACLFCRGRKIACGPPPPDGDGKTCNQCHRRSLKCEYPAESRRGMRKDKPLPNLDTGGAKVVVKTRKR